jgi:uncharacterized membrane protein YphA (DoxX/SURF4 family)
MEKYSHHVLRIGIGFVFLWFGYSALTNSDMWIRLVPAWTGFLGEAKTLVTFHGIFELIFGLLLMAGIRTRIVATLLGLSLLHTLFLVSGPTLIRDIGLLAALASLALNPHQ